jgi:hypothetical protein
LPLKPGVGAPGGQQYPVLRSIQKFLQQMAEGGARAAATVIKEILQNADDAGANELVVVLDERQAPAEMPADYATLFGPALLVRNNARFRLAADCEPGEPDDFAAIRDVARGHKRAQATAAGRFGIGFNSVYFLTDTPLLFSRREVHIFDLNHRVFEVGVDGWRFTLDDFPADAPSRAGAIKWVLEWCFPKVALADRSFADLAIDPAGDYQQAIFRLPLRRTPSGTPAIYDDRFPKAEDRLRVLREMVEESARSILFLKSITSISFSVLREREPEAFARVTTTPPPPQFVEFLQQLREFDRQDGLGPRCDSRFDRTIACHWSEAPDSPTDSQWTFHVWHTARFDDAELLRLRERLRQNEERAVPWAALAVPVDIEACRMDGGGPAAWRVFLPLLEEGPSSCVFNASLFIGPSRQRIEFRPNESDEGKRRTEWNMALVETTLIPLLQNLSTDLPDLAQRLLEDHPREYLSLFPRADDAADKQPISGLTAFVRNRFARGMWLLRLPDLWGEQVDVLVGDESTTLALEMIPEWLSEYRDRFHELSNPQRRFVRYALGDALAARVGRMESLSLSRQPSTDVALAVLRHSDPPKSRDLLHLLQIVERSKEPPEVWEGAWAFAGHERDRLLRYSAVTLYVLDDRQREPPALAALRGLGLAFEGVDWVRPDVGLAVLAADLRPRLENIADATASAALELLRRLPEANRHDQLTQPMAIKPIVDFLIGELWTHIPPDARLGFLVRTAHQKETRRTRGVILLRPEKPTASDEALWDVWFRRIFAEVDPGFAREVNRLLAAHPGSLSMLHASDCPVAVGSMREAFAILHSVRMQAPTVYELLEAEMNGDGGKHEDASQRIASGLLEAADTQWDGLDDEQRYTVLALPIHRRPNGQFEHLLPARDGDISSLRAAFRLQSNEDVEDAPVTLPACQLLQTANAAARHFYRQRLGLEDHGRVAVLKDVLRQIGSADEPASKKMLQYLATHYEDTLRRLQATGDESDDADAQELSELFASSRTVPCLDGDWHPASDCSGAWSVAERLTSQGWPRQRIAWLLGQLFQGVVVARPEGWVQQFVQRLHRLREHDPKVIAELAIRSEGAELSLKDRVKLLTDNWRDRPETTVAPAAAVAQLEVPVLGGRTAMASAESLEERATLPGTVLRALAPDAVDVRRLVDELGLRSERVLAVLQAFGVPRRSPEDIDGRLVERFATLWPSLRHEDRLSVLGHIGERSLAAGLYAQAGDLDTVLVATRPRAWQTPARVLTPAWASTQPPHLPLGAQPAHTGVNQSTRAVWDEWCRVRSFADVLALVLEGIAKGTSDSSATAVYQWLDRIVATAGTDDVMGVLATWPWVLAQRGSVREFHRPSDVLLHPGERVLRARFWVPAAPVPEFARRAREVLGFAAAPPATPDAVREVGDCLADPAAVSDDDGAAHCYALVGQLLEESESLKGEWQRIATRLPVFRAFRREERQVSSQQLFMGDGDFKEDLSTQLLCLKATSSLPKGIIGLYRRLGVEDRPSLRQILGALANIESAEGHARASHGRLVRAIEGVAASPDATIEAEVLGAVRVMSCAGTYEPVSRSLWDEQFGRRERLASASAVRLIDTTDRNTQKLIDWLRAWSYDGPIALRASADIEVSEEPPLVALTPAVSYLLLPWRQWTEEALREGSALREKLAQLGLSLPHDALRIVPVDRLRVRCRFHDGEVVEQAVGWEGPVALAEASGRLFVRPALRGASRTVAAAVSQVDTDIARELAILLGGARVFANLKPWADEILATLERPSTVLRQLRETYRQHFLHQYHDQVADPQFADLFDEYQRTVRSSKRAADLEERMHGLLAEGFVRARREQIRGYGYDEFSVFAELLQNAEDAYIQRSWLGMEMPSTCSVMYRYVEAESGQVVLEVEHGGRPFNYWQHGSQQDRSFSRDVEGVLRSAGSFKPHVGLPDPGMPHVPTIGRFGLGFKSVYLITDRPEIHSGAWHFAIEAGCLPEEVSSPEDLHEDATRLRLPLRADAETLNDASKLRDLLPFLGMVRRLEFRREGLSPAEFAVVATATISVGPTVVEQVSISGPDAVGVDGVRFIRCRSRNHAGQLAVLVAREGTPARWDEAFDYDLFAALPLRAELGCGVAASHRFEVQSGRTHLVDPKANAGRVIEVAALLEGLAEALPKLASADAPLCELLTRFWAVWRWDRGDAECESLRKQLASTLVGLAEHMSVVPTLDPERPTSLADGPRFYFSELPDTFRDAVVAAGVTIPVPGFSVSALASGNVVAEGFAGAYRRACEYAGLRRARTLAAVGWDEIAKAFQERGWFAERPELLSSLAESLSEEQAGKVAAWVALCPVLAQDGAKRTVHALASELLPPTFPGLEHLPNRFISRVSPAYGEAALKLLSLAGLRAQPSSDEIYGWLLADSVAAPEGIGVLRYLADDDRFRAYWGLAVLFRSPWFPENGGRLSTADAARQGLIPDELLANDVFRSWLGLSDSPEPPIEPGPPPRNPREVLEDLFTWWQAHGASWTAQYEERLYPTGHPPTLRDRFSPRDLGDRRQWITLLLLGALHTMGRTQPEQHRDFLRRCERKGWLDVFADADHDARRWMQVLEEYLEDPSGKLDYYQWMNQFVRIFQISRWLSEYVESFLNVDRITQPFALDQITAPRESAFFSGGGPDAPALTRALGIGACFVMRELIRFGRLRQPLAHRYCYVPSLRVCTLLEQMGCANLHVLALPDRSSGIHRFVAEHLGPERATFDRSFDLPLLALADDPDLQIELLGRVVSPDNDAPATGVDGVWRVPPGGRPIQVNG